MDRKGRWPRTVRNWKELRAFQSRTEAATRFISSTSLPIPILPCHFLSNRWLRCSARRGTAQLGPSCANLPSSAASPRPDPAAGPGPSRSPAPCRSAARRLRLGYWQRDNLPCQQKKPECATEKLSGVKTYKNKKGENDNGPKQREGMGKVQDPGKWSSFFAALAVSGLLT